MARSFNGTSDVIMSSSVGAGIRLTAGSLACWAYFAGSPSNYPNSYSFIDCGSGSPQNYWLDAESTFLRFYYTTGGSNVNIETGAVTWQVGVWYHFAMTTADFTLAGTKLYINGISQSLSITGTAGTPDTSTRGLEFGGFQGGTTALLSGRLADVAIWNVALSAGEISGLASGGRPYQFRLSALKGWWPFDGLQSPEPDLSGNAFNGTLTGTAFVAGPPTMMFTPRQPQVLAAASAPTFLPAWAMQRNISADGVAT